MVQQKGGAPEAVRVILNSVLTRFLRGFRMEGNAVIFGFIKDCPYGLVNLK
jgi:hypothetical protein